MVDTRVHKIGHQFGRFIVAGLLSTAINYGVFYILFKLGVPYMVAMAIGFLAGAAFGFHLNRVWTYEIDTISTGLMARYLAVYLVSLFAGMAFIWFFVEKVSFSPELANLLTIIVTTICNFAGTKLWVFKK